MKQIRDSLWVFREKRVGLLGLAFKGNTDDVRNSVAMDLAQIFLKEGAHVIAYDPQGAEKAKEIEPRLEIVSRGEDVAEKADVIVVATEWKEFRDLDWASMRKRALSNLLFDGRNLLDPAKVAALGFEYHSIGRR